MSSREFQLELRLLSHESQFAKPLGYLVSQHRTNEDAKVPLAAYYRGRLCAECVTFSA